MAKRVYLVRDWQEACARALENLPEGGSLGDVLDELGGPSPGGAAADLGISRARVYQLIEAGRLDAVYLKDKPKSRPHVVMVTVASMGRYRRSKPGVQQPLQFVRPGRRVSGGRH